MEYIYDAFGNVLSQDGEADNSYLFSSKECHLTSDLVYFGVRYYDPSIGRFITRDPLGMVNGPNVYIYCNNNPINYIDPWGLCGEKKERWWEKTRAWWRRSQEGWETSPIWPEEFPFASAWRTRFELDPLIGTKTFYIQKGIKLGPIHAPYTFWNPLFETRRAIWYHPAIITHGG